jgi:hypothetical protein
MVIVPVVEELTITGPDTFDNHFCMNQYRKIQVDDFVEIDNGAIGVMSTLNATKECCLLKQVKNLMMAKLMLFVKTLKISLDLKMVSKKWE